MSKRKMLVAGPWVGEFGWELMAWQGAVRAHVAQEKFDHVAVFSRSYQGEYLYRDIADIFFDVPCFNPASCDQTIGKPSRTGYGVDGFVSNHPYFSGFEIERFDGTARRPNGQYFIKYGEFNPALAYDVVIHARASDKFDTGYYNWPMENWAALIERNSDLRFCCIGHATESAEVPGIKSFIGESLETTCNVLASSLCVMGPSSGPIHLAALCGTPTVCWTDFNHVGRWGLTNEMRLREDWNPFNVPVELIDGWQPSVAAVNSALERIFDHAPTLR